MTTADRYSSGKGHRDENFPVASMLVRAELRPAILAFYRFARAADDIADHDALDGASKLARLDSMEAGLLGEAGTSPEGEALHAVLKAQGVTHRHALDLLKAFRTDVTKRRYADWDELMDYCRYSAAPVGRFVLDLHGERSTIWPLNDALCGALQIINHLQDCAKDRRSLDRVYIPLDVLARRGIGVEALDDRSASPPLREAIAELAGRTSRQLLEQSRPFAGRIADRRLALEVGIIWALAESLASRLQRCDPLSQRVHHRSWEAAGIAIAGGLAVATQRLIKGVGLRRTHLNRS